MAKTQSVAVQMAEILEGVQTGAEDALKRGIDQTSKESVQKLRNTSPKKSGSYARGWAVKKDGDTITVHNRTDYQLTHLLENGHVVRNKKGEYGRARPIKHIAPVEEWAADELPRRVMEDLNI